MITNSVHQKSPHTAGRSTPHPGRATRATVAEPLSPEATFVIPLGIAGTPEPWHVRIVLADGHVVKVWEVADRAARQPRLCRL
ncbi:hypothetical protein OG239_04235 [Streptomyces sp. NBC_00868]|uniref:hypothetical protein n=1 Tax=Streptomyces sp. NBC_00868 TaxID=2903683 RepID=UPI00386F0DD5|nr:hypothetical protein OG239_04235 [Streptomyces sp. NBC_00868]